MNRTLTKVRRLKNPSTRKKDLKLITQMMTQAPLRVDHMMIQVPMMMNRIMIIPTPTMMNRLVMNQVPMIMDRMMIPVQKIMHQMMKQIRKHLVRILMNPGTVRRNRQMKAPGIRAMMRVTPMQKRTFPRLRPARIKTKTLMLKREIRNPTIG